MIKVVKGKDTLKSYNIPVGSHIIIFDGAHVEARTDFG